MRQLQFPGPVPPSQQVVVHQQLSDSQLLALIAGMFVANGRASSAPVAEAVAKAVDITMEVLAVGELELQRRVKELVEARKNNGQA